MTNRNFDKYLSEKINKLIDEEPNLSEYVDSLIREAFRSHIEAFINNLVLDKINSIVDGIDIDTLIHNMFTKNRIETIEDYVINMINDVDIVEIIDEQYGEVLVEKVEDIIDKKLKKRIF